MQAHRPAPPGAGQASSGKEAVDLAQGLAELKTAAQADTSAAPRTIVGRTFRKVGDAWVDQGFTPKMPPSRLRVLGKAYFRLLASHPELRSIFALGNRITWVSPSGTAVIIDSQGQDDADQASLDRLFRQFKTDDGASKDCHWKHASTKTRTIADRPYESVTADKDAVSPRKATSQVPAQDAKCTSVHSETLAQLSVLNGAIYANRHEGFFVDGGQGNRDVATPAGRI